MHQYYDMDTVKYLMEKLYRDGYGDYDKDPDYTLKYTEDVHKVTFERENGSKLLLDFDQDTLTFDNYDAFISHSFSLSFLSPVYGTNTDDDGKSIYITRDKNREVFKCGKEYVFDTGRYGIDLVCSEDKFLIPAQTVADVLISSDYVYYLYYGKRAFFISDETMQDERNPLDGVMARYYDCESEPRSRELIDFTYNELCMALDYEYGLKSNHNIDCFDEFMQDYMYNGKSIKEYICSDNPVEMDQGLAILTWTALDDIHSSLIGQSPYTGIDRKKEILQIPDGPATKQYYNATYKFRDLRNESFLEESNPIPGYQEVGNTAYITLDSFDAMPTDYYDNPPAEIPDDTVGLIIYAHSQITRENSPIENIVLDLTCNTGGYEDSSAYAISWLLGEAQMSSQDPNIGAYAYTTILCDTTLDHVFDEKDNVSDYNRYCLISPMSLSCGNVVPSILKNSNEVTIIGQKTHGGGCFVFDLSTASGSTLTLSGPSAYSVMKNGVLYDVDAGVEPDLYISKPENFYNREKLTDYINSLN